MEHSWKNAKGQGRTAADSNVIPTGYAERHAESLRELEHDSAFFGEVFKRGPGEAEEEKSAEAAPRKFSVPREMTFEQYIGQKRHVTWLRKAIAASERTGKPLPHMAIIGEAGMGKTSLAACCADAMESTALATVGSDLKNMNDVADFVEQVNGGVAFIDEAHDLSKAETPIISGLLPLLEDWTLYAKGGATQVDPFTCVMATTDLGMLDHALRSRMGIPYDLEPYTLQDMRDIVLVHAEIEDFDVTRNAAYQIAKRSRGNPRFSINILRRCITVAVADDKEKADVAECIEAFEALELDHNGLLRNDRRLLDHLRAGPCSVNRCAVFLGMSKVTFEQTIEKFLEREEYIQTTSKGKSLTTKGEQYVENQRL